MSYAEEMGYDGYDVEEYIEDYRMYWTLVWEELKKKNRIWQDKYGNQLSSKSIDNRYLKRILNFCNTRFRPKEQIEALTQLANQRGIIK